MKIELNEHEALTLYRLLCRWESTGKLTVNVGEETPPQKGKSKTAATSDSRKRSKHKHIYKKIILHYGSDSFSWGGQCEICGRLDSTYKSSNWNPEELQVTGEGLYGEWRSICLTEIHRRYPEYTIMTLEHAKWVEWTGENDKEKKEDFL